MGSIFSIFKKGLEKSATKVTRAISGLFTGTRSYKTSDFEELEMMLISADFGIKAATAIVKDLKEQYETGHIATDADLVAELKKKVIDILSRNRREINRAPEGPTVILMVGVNGSGKTTSIGKLAWKLVNEDKCKVVLGACDTFRAAAVEQLQLWSERTGAQIVSAVHGADPASVAFDATSAAVARQADYLLIDTAGRQHNQKDLMAELEKIRRSVSKVLPGAPHEVWLTVDSSLGANVVNQARDVIKTAGVTGLVLTKLDGTGRGGMALALHEEFDLPTFYVGLGEQPGELQYFDPVFYADALFEIKE